jgi:hypothetical protein
VSQDLGDVVVRARGLALHLLPQRALDQLAHSAGSGVLASALQGVGYWPAPSAGGAPATAAALIDDAIEYEIGRRLHLIARWLGRRRATAFACVFEDEQRRALRGLLRRFAFGSGQEPAATVSVAWALPRRLRRALDGAREPIALARVLSRQRSPYGPALEQAIREHGTDLRPVEAALDRTFTQRAAQSAAAFGGRLAGWVADGIDLENAWDALLQGGGEFLEGGALLSREQHAGATSDPDPLSRRRRLATALAPGGLDVFDDPEAPLATLEARALAARIRLERRHARIEPLGSAPVLLAVLRFRAERADLRRINAGIALGLSASAIVGQLTGTV